MPRAWRPCLLPMGFMARMLRLILTNILQSCSPAMAWRRAAQPANWPGEALKTMTSVFLDELKPGMSASMTRTVTEQHVQLFREPTAHMNAVHFHQDYPPKPAFPA